MIDRINGNLSLDTSETNYFRLAFAKLQYLFYKDQKWNFLPDQRMVLADPFARNCQLAGKLTNDLNPETRANHHLDAITFMGSLDKGSVDAVIFDPPFSSHQAKKYEGQITNVYTQSGYIKNIMTEIDRTLKPGGYLLKFGFNSTKHRHYFDLVHMWIVNHGGNHNDTIVTLWQKNQHHIDSIIWGESE